MQKPFLNKTQTNLNTLLYKAHTHACGKRKIFDKTKNTLSIKTKPITTYFIMYIVVLEKLRSKLVPQKNHTCNSNQKPSTLHNSKRNNTLNKPHIKDCKLAYTYLRTFKQKYNMLRGWTSKKQITKPLETITYKLKLIKPNSQMKTNNTINSHIYTKKK